MSDKILVEAFDKMKAIEESDDPFCIGASADTEFTEAYTAVDEGKPDWSTPTEYEMTDDSGHHYRLTYQNNGGEDEGFLEVNGITVAHYTVGGAGPMNTNIQKPDLMMQAIEALFMGK